MKFDAVRFPYLERDSNLGLASRQPILPITLTLGSASVSTTGLIDTGASLNVIPHHLGLQLGLEWDQQATSVQLTGNLASVEAKVLIASADIAGFPTVRLAFAWAASDSLPLLLGHVNFLLEFDVCFFGSRSEFEVRPKT